MLREEGEPALRFRSANGINPKLCLPPYSAETPSEDSLANLFLSINCKHLLAIGGSKISHSKLCGGVLANH